MTIRRYTGILLAIALCCAVGPSRADAQDREATTRALEKAMRSADVKALIGRMSDRVGVAVFGASREYSKTQAEYVLRDFFSEYPPESFRVNQSSETDQGAFLAGVYASTRYDKDIDVYMRLRERGGRWELREVIIRTEPR